MSTLPPLSAARAGTLVFTAIATAVIFVIFVKPDLAGRPLYEQQMADGRTKISQGRAEDAEKAFEAALRTAQAARLDRSRLQEAMKNLILALKAGKKWDKAAQLQQKYDRARGFLADKTWTSSYQTAENFMAQGKFSEAMPYLQRANQHARKFGEQNPLLARGHELSARIALAQGDYKTAEEQARISLAMRRSLFPAADPTLVDSLAMLAQTQIKQGKYEEAESSLKEGLELLARTIGLKNEKAGKVYLLLIENACAKGDQAAADQWKSESSL